jgi:hypothetical protein
VSEHPTERFVRPPMPPADPEPSYQAEPSYDPLFGPPDVDDSMAGPPADPPPPLDATTRMEPAPPAAARPNRGPRLRRPAPAPRDSARSGGGAAANIARQWFNQSDNVLMAITAVVAVVFLVLVGILA